jgi:hypothetical protein
LAVSRGNLYIITRKEQKCKSLGLHAIMAANGLGGEQASGKGAIDGNNVLNYR